MITEKHCLPEPPVPERIVKFIRRHHVMTLATVSVENTLANGLAADSRIEKEMAPSIEQTVTSGAVDSDIENSGIEEEILHIAEPWCASLFYSYMPDENLFVFTTEQSTRHGAALAAGGIVAASIVLETRNVGLVQGLQLQGYVRRVDALDGAIGECHVPDILDAATANKAGSANRLIADGKCDFKKKARTSYLKRFPYAALADLTLLVLSPRNMKLTDNRLGFGRKLHWP